MLARVALLVLWLALLVLWLLALLVLAIAVLSSEGSIWGKLKNQNKCIIKKIMQKQ